MYLTDFEWDKPKCVLCGHHCTAGPDDHEALLSPYGTWLIKGKDGKFEHVPNVVATQSYNNIVKTGYLTKSPPPGAMKGWKRRYFVLSGASEVTGEAKLEYYEDEDSVRGSEPKGMQAPDFAKRTHSAMKLT